MEKTYLMINKLTNIVENIVIWTGNTDEWSPPSMFITRPQEEVMAQVWQWNGESKEWNSADILGMGGIGDIWNGERLNRNKPEPISLPNI